MVEQKTATLVNLLHNQIREIVKSEEKMRLSTIGEKT